jgi:uncharacterized membrane protein YhaH (DUF805 family)
MSAHIRKIPPSKPRFQKIFDMEAPQRGALMLVRFTAIALICLTILQLSLYLLDYRFHDHPLPPILCALWTIPFIIGVAVLIKSKAIAAWISDRLDL